MSTTVQMQHGIWHHRVSKCFRAGSNHCNYPGAHAQLDLQARSTAQQHRHGLTAGFASQGLSRHSAATV